ncbi:MAG: GTP 3',8-cyclase MoaA [Verrucomicrobia bacterium]|nr:GTP 3',8-cyclase MoaA [Verrucomicrobiota bacterium]MCH8528706.1 GTP 3',8-cyclase MoaA [Kiritimatiellia bacterium]
MPGPTLQLKPVQPLSSRKSENRRLSDKHGREIHYLRVSLTDACNLRCVYCMPEHMKFRPQSENISLAEYRRLLPLFHALGFDKFRFTGGEPTLHPQLTELIAETAALPGAPFVALTTNGMLLPKLARPLKTAGLRRVNISLDTLDPARFRQMSRRDGLDAVLRGLDAAEAAGLEIKLNAVTVRNFNEEDFVPLARFSLDRPWQVRFLEMMPFGNNEHFQNGQRVEEDSVKARIEAALGKLEPVGNGLDGEARVYRVPGAKGTVGFISPVSAPFCGDCNRARLTADGKLRLCLLKDDEVDLLTPLRKGADNAALENIVRAGIWEKPWGHELAFRRFSHNRGMSEIGG